MKKILPIWQPIGNSTHIISKKVSEKLGVLTSHTGTLDPMAEGVIIILLDEERLKKYEYAHWKKTYVFEILFGVSTDTFDALGLITKTDFVFINKTNLSETIKSFSGHYTQIIPPYAAIKIKGKPAHWYARNKKKVKLPTREGEIYKIKLISLKNAGLDEIIEEIVKKIKKIEGDLRQDEISKNWMLFSKRNTIKKVQIAKIEVEMSKGLYVRSLVTDIAKKLKVPALTFSIIRTKNGKYSKSSSKSLKDVID